MGFISIKFVLSKNGEDDALEGWSSQEVQLLLCVKLSNSKIMNHNLYFVKRDIGAYYCSSRIHFFDESSAIHNKGNKGTL